MRALSYKQCTQRPAFKFRRSLNQRGGALMRGTSCAPKRLHLECASPLQFRSSASTLIIISVQRKVTWTLKRLVGPGHERPTAAEIILIQPVGDGPAWLRAHERLIYQQRQRCCCCRRCRRRHRCMKPCTCFIALFREPNSC